MLSWLLQQKQQRKARRRLAKFERAQAWSQARSIQQAFEDIYAGNEWGASREGLRFSSGNGSRAEFSAPYEDFVVAFLDRHRELRRIVDIGCGDFQVSSRILARLDRPVTYTGCDIVRDLISYHHAHHRAEGVEFRALNAVEEDPPSGDAVFLRQILQHLSNAQIAAILSRVRRLYRVAIVTESMPAVLKAPNLDICHGIATRIPLGSGVYIEKAPFDMEISESFEVPHSPDELIRTSVVWLDATR